MKSKWFVLLLFIIVSINSYGQNNARLSAFTSQLLLEHKNGTNKYPYKTINQKAYLRGLIKVNQDIDLKLLNKLNIIVGTKAGNIWTVKIPNDKLTEFINCKGIDYIDMDKPIHQNIHTAKVKTGVDSVHRAIGLWQNYTGKGVVMGIIDAGYDYGHPTFKDTLGLHTRIKKVWEQKTVGTPPQNYSYGHELSDFPAMLAKGTDNSTTIHGTHVGGIATGSGFGSENNSKYRGVAYESDIVMVAITPEQSQWTNAGLSDIVDGLNYIFSYAQAESKPAVANLSWGCTIGPNDGSSLFNQACDNLCGEGKILVIAAGNNGEDKIHLSKEFTNNDTVIKSFINFSEHLHKKASWLDIWGDHDKVYTVEFSLFNKTSEGNKISFNTKLSMALDTFLIGSDNDTCFLKIVATPSEINNNPRALADIHSKTNDKLCVAVIAKTGNMNMWLGYVYETVGYYGSFETNDMSWAVEGNSNMTLGEIACTKSAITVGAYTSRIDWTDIDGNGWSYNGYALNNRIAPFSSRGPTLDNRIKPEITAPGLTITSAVSSYDVAYLPNGSNYFYNVSKYTDNDNNRDYYYAEASGTSMAAPVVSGIIALMLEINPKLTPTQVKDIIISTAVKDTYTTSNPNPNIWGYGKINAYKAIQKTIELTRVEESSFPTTKVNIFPNPNKGEFEIKLTSTQKENININISDIMGKIIYSKNININIETNNVKVKIENIFQGTYILKVSSDKQQKISKLIIN